MTGSTIKLVKVVSPTEFEEISSVKATELSGNLHEGANIEPKFVQVTQVLS